MRRVGCVQRLCPELDTEPLLKSEIAEKARVEVDHIGSVERVVTGSPEANSGHGPESRHVENRRTGADSTESRHTGEPDQAFTAESAE